ncbi:GTPase [Arthrobacter sp. MDT1-48-3]
MSRPGDAAVQTPLASSLTDALDRLATAYDLGVDRLPPERLERLHATLDRAGSRRSLSGNHTVVGVFGPTGSGKSSLVNALSGTGAARVAVRRPTTSEPLALVWESAGSGELLDWLGVGQRVELPAGAPLLRGLDLPGHDGATADSGEPTPSALLREEPDGARGAGDTRRGPAKESRGVLRRIFGRRRRGAVPSRRDDPSGSAAPVAAADAAGLILLDLPDFDSTAAAHRDVVERLARQVDVLLWVVDPQKYADAALHHGFLRGLASHEAVTLVALNQADRLEPADLDAVTSSLAGILAGEGLPGVAVLPVSARTGTGLDALAAAIRAHAESRAAATRRLSADAAGAATELLPFVAEEPVPLPAADARSTLSDELGVAAGVPVVVDAVRAAYRRDAHAAAGWPVTRWLARLRPDPLRRLNLRSQDVVPEVRRSSLPLGQPAQRARVDHALRVFGDASAQGAPEPWHTSIRDAARGTAGELTDALDAAVTGTDLETDRRWWWGVFGVLQWVAFAALVTGLVWLGVLAVLGFLQLPAVDVPRVEGFPVPTLLILAGGAAGILLGILAALLARWGAARRATRVRRRLLASCSRAARDIVMLPVEGEVGRCNDFRAAVLGVLRRT